MAGTIYNKGKSYHNLLNRSPSDRNTTSDRNTLSNHGFLSGYSQSDRSLSGFPGAKKTAGRKASGGVKSIIIAVFATILMSFSQVLWKMGSASVGMDMFGILTDVPLIAGFVLYGFCAALMVIALRSGELSAIYPVFALSFVFVNILAWLILSETMNLFRWTGVVVIMAGISLIGFASGGRA